jgi:uncharacterized protein (DUF433 family)
MTIEEITAEYPRVDTAGIHAAAAYGRLAETRPVYAA